MGIIYNEKRKNTCFNIKYNSQTFLLDKILIYIFSQPIITNESTDISSFELR